MAWTIALIVQFYIQALKNYAYFDGRSRRLEFWAFTLFNMVVASIFLVFDHIAGTYNPDTPMGLFNTVYGVLVFIPSLAVSVRRLHDVGYSGWMVLLALIPIIGWIWFIITAATEGQNYSNDYGPNPKDHSQKDTQLNQPEEKFDSLNSKRSVNHEENPEFQCKQCKQRVVREDKFCWNCGNDFRTRICPNCKSEVTRKANFCSKCGDKLMFQEK